MAKSEAKVYGMYRGFLIKVGVTKRASGYIKVRAKSKYHLPDLKPEVSKQYSLVTRELDGEEVEFVSAKNTISELDTLDLYVSNEYDPDSSRGKILGYFHSLFNHSEGQKTVSSLISKSLDQLEGRIDDVISEEQAVEIDPNEVKFGMNQTLTETKTVDVQNEKVNQDVSYSMSDVNTEDVLSDLEIERS